MPSHSQGCEASVALACDLSPHTGSVLALLGCGRCFRT